MAMIAECGEGGHSPLGQGRRCPSPWEAVWVRGGHNLNLGLALCSALSDTSAPGHWAGGGSPWGDQRLCQWGGTSLLSSHLLHSDAL